MRYINAEVVQKKEGGGGIADADKQPAFSSSCPARCGAVTHRFDQTSPPTAVASCLPTFDSEPEASDLRMRRKQLNCVTALTAFMFLEKKKSSTRFFLFVFFLQVESSACCPFPPYREQVHARSDGCGRRYSLDATAWLMIISHKDQILLSSAVQVTSFH